MSKPLLLSIGNGKIQELVGTAESQVPVWDDTLNEWQAAAVPGGGGGGGVTSVGLTGGTSGIVIGGTASPITTSGTYALDAPLRFALNTTTPTAVTAAGQVAYNDTEGSIDSMLKGGNVVLSVGQQIYQRVVNVDSVELTPGMVVYVFGSSGTRVSVKRALADADLTSAAILGVVAENLPVSHSGFVMTSGLMKNLSVLKPGDGFADGYVVYLSPITPGALTVTKPVAPQHIVTVGYVAKSSAGAAGELLVHPQNGYELEELHDVFVSSAASGQILIYDATAGQTRWENATPTGSLGVTVTPGAGSLAFSLDSSYAPTFLNLALSGLTASRFVVTDASKNLVSQQFVSLLSEVSGTLPAANGGTDQTTWSTGDLLYASGLNTLTKRTIGSPGSVLTVSGGVPTWAAPATSGTVTNVSTVATGMGLTLSVANSTTTPTITLAGTLASSKGGTGADLSGSTGILAVLSGTFSAREIGNGDISASAGIGRGKIASGDAWKLVANNGSGVMTEVAATGTSGQVLTSTGTNALPTFQSIPSVPYDLAGEAVNSLSVDQVVFHFIAPRAFTMTALTQANTATTVVKIQVNGVDATYPQAVTTAQTVTAKVTVAGTDVWFTVTGNV